MWSENVLEWITYIGIADNNMPTPHPAMNLAAINIPTFMEPAQNAAPKMRIIAPI
jgi:hypothetical protein